jgi:hypothetical protein
MANVGEAITTGHGLVATPLAGDEKSIITQDEFLAKIAEERATYQRL